MSCVLVVDDDPEIRKTVAMILELEGHRCEMASNSEEAFAFQSKRRADVIVLDYMMPEMSGLEVFRKLRDLGDETPVLFLSADRDIEKKTLISPQSRQAVMKKPFELEEFILAIESLIYGPVLPKNLK